MIVKALLSLLLLPCIFIGAFTFSQNGAAASQVRHRNGVSLEMGLFDGISKAFSNKEFASPPEGINASARHILVKSSEDMDFVIDQLGGGADFGTVAADCSTCPSGKQGGSLGSFSPGTMVREFDSLIFDPNTELGQIVGPVQTKFGYHLIVVDKRTGV
mmetsp:Transcript_16239/g.21253  ORF Transcript_16239/g.21253 Transcript_16239/m.21253 type:complete len:159 (+) Transcript_16239:79-555(+)|eukprot:CAMPEP_0198142208 /NCGR_PEP_ID=MMETSP1443-20131203/5073_1 /TAXON_ID=186043 /ORGANISM="Entomoneis sp., Strain CCMP2396" /LENGTH=158 /DNA_ID=CAMNT_0043805177 /DNA_START=79 /DNA_END=555 /DNA_ORIENTATION=-